MTKKKKHPPWQRIFLIALVVLLGLLFVFSRGYRSARRATISSQQEEERQTHENDTKVGYQDTVEEQSHMKADDTYFTPAITKEALLGKLDPSSHQDFVEVALSMASREGIYMREEAYKAFTSMYEAAREEGVTLRVISGARSFDHQKRIWEEKWNGLRKLHGDVKATDIEDAGERALEILRFSAMPGTSRHHWGTDIDLNSLQNSYFDSFEGREVYRWLRQHAYDYGFCQPYTAHGQDREGGYEEEKWHWSYYPVAADFLRAYRHMIVYEDINGFDGSETAKELDVIEKYVLDINEDCY